MSWFRLLRRAPPPTSAQTAKDRLQITLAHERQERALPDYLPLLQRDLLGVIRRYVEVASDQVQMRFRRTERISMLEIEVELPAPQRTTSAISATAVPSSAFARG